jgi:hypothetical protein
MNTSALEREILALTRASAPRRTRLSLDAFLFDHQLAFANDPAPFVTATCTRRAGKSVGVAAWLLEGPLKGCGPSLYTTITRRESKRIIWPIMLRINREHRLGYVPNESELSLRLNGVPAVYLMGVDTRDEIEKARGTGWGRVAIDEAQTLPPYVEQLVNDVLMPSFMDHSGQLRVIGTPGAVPVGYFHELTQNPSWGHHSWSVWQNPHLPNARAMLEKVLAARGVTEDDPSIQREWFGRWVYDPNSLVFRWTQQNHYDSRPPYRSWQYVIGVDLGFDDADAIAVLAWSDESPSLWLVEEWVGSKQSITDLGKRLGDFVARYEPLEVVADTGGLGKKIADEITGRTGIPLTPADKTRKLEHIELLNDALRSGRLFARRDSRFAADALLVEWDRSSPEKPKISDRYHSDVCDAVLYAYRRAQHWLHEERDHRPGPGGDGYEAEVERELVRSAEAEVKQRKQDRQDAEEQFEWL